MESNTLLHKETYENRHHYDATFTRSRSNKVLHLNYENLKTVILTIYGFAPDDQIDHSATLDNFITSYYNSFNNYLNNNGKEFTLALFKLIHDQATAIALRKSIQPIPFHKSGKDGASNLLVLAKPLLLSNDDRLIRSILTCTRVYEAIRLKPMFDETPITSPYSGEIDLDEFLPQFESFLLKSRWFARLKKLYYRDLKPAQRLRGRIRSGPNGQANITSHYDSIAISETPLYQNISEWNQKWNQTFINDSMDFCIKQCQGLALGEVCTGKISLISERAGKTRTIAVGDFWSQNSLQPFHDLLMKLLKQLKVDCTHDQNKGFFRIQNSGIKHKYILSADLSKATDRFPIAVIESMIYCLTDSREIAALWKDIMVDRSFRYGNLQYKWRVGNPLGLLSSWPSFSLAHHCIVQLAYHQQMKTKKSFTKYAILGDDITIWHRTVAQRYTMIMTGLGVEINKTKSLVSRTGNYRFEFAKRISNNGRELTGMSFDMLVNASKSIYNYVDLILNTVETKLIHKPLNNRVCPRYLNQKGIKYLEYLLWDQELLVPEIFGNTKSELILDKLRRACLHERLLRIKKITEDLDKALGQMTLQEYCTKWGIVYSETLFEYTGSNELHPIVESLNYTGMQLWDSIAILSEVMSDENLLTQDIYPDLKDHEYLPLPYMPAYFERPGKREAFSRQTHSEIVLKCIHNLRDDLPIVLNEDRSPSGETL